MMSQVMEADEEAQVELSIENSGWGAMILKEMDALREKKEHCDVAVMVSDGTQFPAHSVVLCASSPFFKQVIDAAKSTNPSACNILIKCNYSHHVIESVFDFLYRGRVLPKLNQIPAIQRAAKTFGIDTLVTLCQVFTAQTTFSALNQELIIKEDGSQYVKSTTLEECAEEFQNGDSQGQGPEEHLRNAEQYGAEFSGNTTAQNSIKLITESTSADLDNQPETTVQAIATDLNILHAEIIRENVAEEYNVSTSCKKIYRYKCDLCDRIFTSRCRLEGHRATHSGDKLHVCRICGAEFIQVEYLREHQSMHTDARPHKCNTCGLKFRLMRHLKKHAKIHSNRKPFKCTICGAAFRRSDGWKNHLRIHTGEKPFPCMACGRIFSLAESLRRHEIVHTGIKPYKCTVCSTTFRRNDALRKHVTIHSGERPFKCPQVDCSSSFRMKVQLRRHIGIFHKNTKYDCDTYSPEVSKSQEKMGHSTCDKNGSGSADKEIQPKKIMNIEVITDSETTGSGKLRDLLTK